MYNIPTASILPDPSISMLLHLSLERSADQVFRGYLHVLTQSTYRKDRFKHTVTM